MIRGSLWTILLACSATSLVAAEPWTQHTIDDSFRGADGVRLADFNDDGLADIVTGWEESGIIRLYLNPGSGKARQAWPSVSVGRAASPEDAVPMDVDGDGRLDVISCHEGKTRRVLVHFNRSDNESGLLAESSWETAEWESIRGQAWMFALPLVLSDGRPAVVVGSKGSGGSITLLVSPGRASADLQAWQTIQLREAGWIMSLRLIDVDDDGRDDVLFSDRKGTRRGVGWLRQPVDVNDTWSEQMIGGSDCEVMFLDVVSDPKTNRLSEILVSTRNSLWLRYQRENKQWVEEIFDNPASVPHGKAIARLSDGRLVMTANTNAGGVPKVPGLWLRNEDQTWHPISRVKACKYDRIELIDLNGDGHQDILTCEERRNLGVVWYENPN